MAVKERKGEMLRKSQNKDKAEAGKSCSGRRLGRELFLTSNGDKRFDLMDGNGRMETREGGEREVEV